MSPKNSGKLGEQITSEYLIDNGYDILDINYRTRHGEVDIIAKKDDILVFVEVKTRAEDSIIKAREFVTASKQQKIIKTAAEYIAQGNFDCPIRFDVVEVVIKKGDTFKVQSIKHIKQAFEMGIGHAFF